MLLLFKGLFDRKKKLFEIMKFSYKNSIGIGKLQGNEQKHGSFESEIEIFLVEKENFSKQWQREIQRHETLTTSHMNSIALRAHTITTTTNREFSSLFPRFSWEIQRFFDENYGFNDGLFKKDHENVVFVGNYWIISMKLNESFDTFSVT